MARRAGKVRLCGVRNGWLWYGRQGTARSGPVPSGVVRQCPSRLGSVWQAGCGPFVQGRVLLGTAWSGWVWQARCVVASSCGVGCLLGRVWQGKVWQAWQVAVRLDRVGVGRLRLGRHGAVRLVVAGCGSLSRGLVRFGRLGVAWSDWEWLAMARLVRNQ